METFENIRKYSTLLDADYAGSLATDSAVAQGYGGQVHRFTRIFYELTCHREHRVSFTSRGVDGLVYTNSQPYSKRACAFGLRSLPKLLTLSALVKPEKILFFLERIGTKRHKSQEKISSMLDSGCLILEKSFTAETAVLGTPYGENAEGLILFS